MTASATDPGGNGNARPGGTAGGYAGDIAPRQAWDILAAEPAAVLVDVRSTAEWTFVGLPDIRDLGKEPVLIPWQHFPGMTANAEFVTALRAQVADPAAPILFLCRSGGRSRAAAIAGTSAGFSACYNVAGGFEGNLDESGHRGGRDGWKADGLPWMQS
ncbi:MAG: rhodanese-like domain-containing protein [Sneathiellaceae bacterium]